MKQVFTILIILFPVCYGKALSTPAETLQTISRSVISSHEAEKARLNGRRTCELFVEKPRIEIIDGKRVLVARGGRQCTLSPGDNEVGLTVRIRHHRRFRTDRTLGETNETGIGVNTQARFDCQNGNSIKVFAEVLFQPGFGSAKKKSDRVEVRCSE